MAHRYANFHIHAVAINSASYHVTVTSPCGDANGTFVLPDTPDSLKTLANQMAALDADEATVTKLGEMLFHLLFQGSIKDVYIRCQGMLNTEQDLHLRLSIDMTETDIAVLPWEYMVDPAHGPLALRDVSIVRCVPQQHSIPSMKISHPIKVLLTSAQPLPYVEVEREVRVIEDELAAFGEHIQLTVVPHLTFRTFQQLLRQDYHVWHFVGYCGYDFASATSSLAIENDTGNIEYLSPNKLELLLHDSSIRLVVLDAFEEGKAAIDSLHNLSMSLIRSEIPAVLAIQIAHAQESRWAFAAEFYRTLAEGNPIDACVTEGRKSMFGTSQLGRTSWSIPKLYSRAVNSITFERSDPQPQWDQAGQRALMIGMIAIVLLAILGYLFLYENPTLLAVGGGIGAIIGGAFGLLGWRADQALARQLSQVVGRKPRFAQGTSAGLLLCAIVGWATLGWPKVYDITLGPLGFKLPGVRRVLISEFKLVPDVSTVETLYGDDLHKILLQKLSQAQSLELVCADCPQTTDEVLRTVDLTVQSRIERTTSLRLVADLYGRRGVYLESITVPNLSDSTAAVDQAQTDLALYILKQLNVEVTPDLAEAIRRTPTDNQKALTLNTQGIALIQKQRYDEAVGAFREAIQIDPNYGDAYNNLAVVLYIVHENQEAVAMAQQAIITLPNYSVYQYTLGSLYARLYCDDRALPALSKAVALDPGYVKAYNELGNVYLCLQRWDDARMALEKGRGIDPSFAPLTKNLARVALIEGKIEEAVLLLEKAIPLYVSESPLEATYLLADALARLGDTARSCQQLDIYRGLDPSQLSEWARDAQALIVRLSCP